MFEVLLCCGYHFITPIICKTGKNNFTWLALNKYSTISYFVWRTPYSQIFSIQQLERGQIWTHQNALAIK